MITVAKTQKDVEKYLSENRKVIIYGAGIYAKCWLMYLEKYEVEVVGIFVTQREKNPYKLQGKNVYALNELEVVDRKFQNVGVIVTIAGGEEKWNPFFAELNVFTNIFIVDERIENSLLFENIKYAFETQQCELGLSTCFKSLERGQLQIVERNSGDGYFRLMAADAIKNKDILELVGLVTVKNYEKIYGKIEKIPEMETVGISDSVAQREHIEIYVVTSHFDKGSQKIENSGARVPIQVGAAMTDIRKGFLTDDTGEHISGRNRDYCECTGMYWVWKNTSGQSYVGLEHYRRRMCLNNKSLDYIKEHDIGVVVTCPQFTSETVKSYLSSFVRERDWELLREKILEYDPTFQPFLERQEHGHFFFPCNIALWKREWFDRYCAFAFNVAEQIYQTYRRENIVREDRYMGYLFEELSSLFIMRYYQELNPAITDMEWIK